MYHMSMCCVYVSSVCVQPMCLFNDVSMNVPLCAFMVYPVFFIGVVFSFEDINIISPTTRYKVYEQVSCFNHVICGDTFNDTHC